MPKRSSKNGASSANLVPITPFVDWNSPPLTMSKSETEALGYDSTSTNTKEMKPAFGNWTKETARQLTNHPTAFEVWLVSQANSIHQRKWTVEEATLLFTHVDVVSRQPFDATAPKPPRFARALRALRAFCGTILLGMGIS